MPHLRERVAASFIQKELTWSPCVSIYGMRQCGKTTLASQLSKAYVTLDDDSVLSRMQKGDWSELEQTLHPLTIDEAQKFGPLFDRVKLLVDRKKKPGQFILTGSVRFSLRKEIRESLTGRTTLFELLPFTIAECHNHRQNDFLESVFACSPVQLIARLKARAWCTPDQIKHYLATGGMPGICFKRDEKARLRLWSSHLDTVMARDLPLVLQTRLTIPRLREVYTLLARMQGQPLNRLAIARAAGVSRPTVDSLLRAFEGLFLIRFHGNTVYCEDHGLASFSLAGHQLETRYFWQRWIYSELLAHLRYLHTDSFSFEDYRTRGGAEVPFLVSLPKKGKLGITFDPGPGASEKSLRSLASYRKKTDAKAIVLHLGKTGYVTSTGIPAVPLSWLA
ncbi:AAA family ATPase [Bdellovibrionota bacterium FG-2]